MNRKAHLDQAFDQAKVQVSSTLKGWEPERQYEKKLNNVMNKDKGEWNFLCFMLVKCVCD